MTRLRRPPEPCNVEIVSGRTSPPTCVITWGERELTLDCATVRTLADAIHTATALANAEAAVVATLRKLRTTDPGILAFLTGMRANYPHHRFGIKGTLTLVPGVGASTGAPFCRVNIAPYEPQYLALDALRDIARQWIEVAEAAERDGILTYALADADLDPDQIERVYTSMRNVRPDGTKDSPTT